jgi:hypothetical protein
VLTVVTSEVRVIYQDATDSFVVGRMYLPASLTLAQAQAAAESLIAVLRPLSDCQIARYSVAYRVKNEADIVPRSALLASPIIP